MAQQPGATFFERLAGRLARRRAVRAFRRAGVEVRDLRLEGLPPMVTSRGRLEVGPGLFLRATTVPVHLSTGPEGRLVLGAGVFLNTGVAISAQRSIEVGEGCKLGDMSALYDSNFHQLEEGAEVATGPVRLGRNVWLGRGVVVLPGVEIGDHSVVGAGSVVTASIPAGVLAAGNPAKVLRPLRCSEGFRRR